MTPFQRRRFLQYSTGALAASSGALKALESIVPLRAEEAAVSPSMVRLRPEIEPVVAWIESTPREEILNRAADEMAKGLPYRELMAATFLAGVRNIKPRPVGFKFHAVLVINSVHQLSLDAAPHDRLYPLFWALDYFKDSQRDDITQGDWSLPPANESAVPSSTEAAGLFDEAMEKWDAEKADSAAIALARIGSSGEATERFWQFGARNFRNLGHNIIFCAQAFRTLDVIGWKHAEPVLRSLAYGLLDGTPGESSTEPFEPARALAKTAKPDWPANKPDDAATLAFLDALRSVSPVDASRQAAEMLNRGVAAESIWDGILLASSEWSMRRRGIQALHSMTGANGFHYGYHSSRDPRTRVLLLLQAAAWMAMYRDLLTTGRGAIKIDGGPRIDQLQKNPGGEAPSPDHALAQLASDRMAAAAETFALASAQGSDSFLAAARASLLAKAKETHDLKFPAAAFEESLLAGERWRPHILAASVFNLRPSTEADSPLTGRIRQALDRIKA